MDLSFTNFPVLIQNTQVIPGLSDHDIVMIESKIKPLFLDQTNRKIPLYDKADWQSVTDGLQSIERHVHRIFSEDVDVENLWK